MSERAGEASESGDADGASESGDADGASESGDANGASESERPGGAGEDEDAGDPTADQNPGDGRPATTVEVDDVDVTLGGERVLDGASLAVAPGELVGVVGPNGAGKTTLCRTINGVLAPDEGTVRVAGADVAGLSRRETARRVATVPQDTTLAFDFSVADVVAMGRTPHAGRFSHDADGPEAVERAMRRTETLQFRDRSVGELSGGERQRVVLARALAQEAPAMVLDEPTASLDVRYQVATLELVRDVVDADGVAAVAAIHDLDLAARFCDRIAVLADGDLLAVGAPDEVLDADVLERAFDVEVAVGTDPATGTPTVTALSGDGGTT